LLTLFGKGVLSYFNLNNISLVLLSHFTGVSDLLTWQEKNTYRVCLKTLMSYVKSMHTTPNKPILRAAENA